jgi:desulfoferrodoxin (superoxide reductase-like protein)
MDDGDGIGCSNCGYIGQNHKGGEILKVQVTVTFEIPITEADKQHILWENLDSDNEEGLQEHIKYAKEISAGYIQN